MKVLRCNILWLRNISCVCFISYYFKFIVLTLRGSLNWDGDYFCFKSLVKAERFRNSEDCNCIGASKNTSFSSSVFYIISVSLLLPALLVIKENFVCVHRHISPICLIKFIFLWQLWSSNFFYLTTKLNKLRATCDMI